jgi:hypothetical protein
MMGQAMSFTSFTRSVVPKSGSPLPVRDRLAGALEGVPAKWLARVTGRTPKAAERWKEASNSMTIETLFALAREFDQVWDIVRHECGRADDIHEAELMLSKMAALLSERKRQDAR